MTLTQMSICFVDGFESQNQREPPGQQIKEFGE